MNSESAIIEFDWDKQKIRVTEEAQKKLNALAIPLQELPVAMVVNGKIIYGFWLWNAVSSFGCDRLYTYPKSGFEIKFGLPTSHTYGENPRLDDRIKIAIRHGTRR